MIWPGASVNPPPGGSVTVLVTTNYTYIIGGMLGFDPVDLQGRSTMILTSSDRRSGDTGSPNSVNYSKYKLVFILFSCNSYYS